MKISYIKREIIAATLKEIGLYSDTALNLVTGTGLVESGYKTTIQYGGGPALGWFQMEPATHDDCWRNYLVYRKGLAQKILSLLPENLSPVSSKFHPQASCLIYPAYAAAMCRVKYLRVPAPLPPDDAASLSLYHKRYYNTMQGKADATKNIPLFQAAIDA